MQPLVIRHGQHGEGTRGQEMLMGHAVMGKVVADGADDARLGIGEFGNPDPRRRTQGRSDQTT